MERVSLAHNMVCSSDPCPSGLPENLTIANPKLQLWSCNLGINTGSYVIAVDVSYTRLIHCGGSHHVSVYKNTVGSSEPEAYRLENPKSGTTSCWIRSKPVGSYGIPVFCGILKLQACKQENNQLYTQTPTYLYRHAYIPNRLCVQPSSTQILVGKCCLKQCEIRSVCKKANATNKHKQRVN